MLFWWEGCESSAGQSTAVAPVGDGTKGAGFFSDTCVKKLCLNLLNRAIVKYDLKHIALFGFSFVDCIFWSICRKETF